MAQSAGVCDEDMLVEVDWYKLGCLQFSGAAYYSECITDISGGGQAILQYCDNELCDETSCAVVVQATKDTCIEYSSTYNIEVSCLSSGWIFVPSPAILFTMFCIIVFIV